MKIAITGMAFRFPGDLGDEDALWEMLKNAGDVVGTVPAERWGTDVYFHPRRSEPGRSVSFAAGTLSRIDEFDAGFFGISPREAKQMDPQQRLLLEMAWEALENGGQIPARLAGSDCAVYIGISGLDYGMRSIDDLSATEAYSMTGNTLSLAANRISYVFDLHGPSMAVDTACSSSMVALHQACKSLREGESATAIAGGVNLLLHPYPFVGFTKASMLSATGRCKAFDAAGDGYVRSEGGAILFLKPLHQAEADGDPIHAVILASGVNTDGNKSGITIPSADAQAELMRKVRRQAGVEAKDIVYVEAHGTGTAVGDPIETAAIGAAIGRHKDAPLYIGSVKANMGHLEPAAGMAGLVKTVLCLKHRALPATPHLKNLNPNIDFAGLNLEPVTRYTALPKQATPLRMGVNSFGFGGANAHVILEEYPARPSARQASPRPAGAPTPPLFLSARHPGALKALAASHAERILAAGPEGYYDLAWSSAFRRERLEQRLAVFGPDPETIAARLERFAAGEGGPGAVAEHRLSDTAKLAFVYSGNGAQWLGMGRQLMAESPLFRRGIEEIDALLAPLAGFSLSEEFTRAPAESRLHLTEVAQPALFAVQVGITRILREFGLEAGAALGHSVGEVAAAWATGALDLEQAILVIHERSAAQALTQGQGRMAVVGLGQAQAREILAACDPSGEIEIAGVNSPNSVTLSGDLKALQGLQAELETRAVFFRLLDLDYAFHSRRMAPIRERVMQRLAGLRPDSGTGRFVSTVTGAPLDGDQLDAEYWWRNIRQPVQFAKAVAALAKDGYEVFLEIGPNAILQRHLRDCLQGAKSGAKVLATVARDHESLARLEETAYRIHLLGCPLDLDRAFPRRGVFVPLPSYPWQRERHWYSASNEGYNLIERSRAHPLLGYRLKDGEAAWENQLDPQVVPYLRDHVVAGAIVLPAAAYVELALAASARHFGGTSHEIEELEIRSPILLDPDQARTLRFELNPADGGFRIKSRPRLATEDWTVNAVGRLIGATLASPPPPLAIAEALAGADDLVDAERHYRLCGQIGLDYGPAFQGFEEGWQIESGLLAGIRLPPEAEVGAASQILHPVALDSAFQTLLTLFRDEIEAGRRATLLPVRVGRLRLFGPGQVRYCLTRVLKRSPHSVLAEFRLLDRDGHTLAELENCRFRAAPMPARGRAKAAEWVYTAHLKPHRDRDQATPLPTNPALRQGALAVLAAEETALRRDEHFRQAVPLFDALVGAFAYRAFRAEADATGRLNVAAGDDRARSFRAWLLTVLEEDELIERRDDGWRFTSFEHVAPEAIWLTILGDNPAYAPDLALAGRVGNHLGEILSGQIDGAELAASLGAGALMEQLTEASPTYRGINRALGAMLARTVESWPANRRLRILELGNGSRALTRMLLPLLPAEAWDYVVAEADPEALARAEVEFANLGHLTCLRLDPETRLPDAPLDPSEGFDIVLAGHGALAAVEPTLALAALKQCLNRGGLLLLPLRQPDRLSEFSFGLDAQPRGLEFWWRRLDESGYAEIETVIEAPAGAAGIGAYVLLARNPDAAPEALKPSTARWLLVVDPEEDSQAFAHALCEQLSGQGQTVDIALAAGHASHLGHTGRLDRYRHIVHLAGLTLRDDTDAIDLMAVQDRRCLGALDLVQGIVGAGRAERPRLWLVTGHGAVLSDLDGRPIPGRHIPSQSALWGFGRVLANEHPDLDRVMIDLRHDRLDAETAAALAQELLHPDGEDEIVLSPDARHATRMRRCQANPNPAEADNVRLGFDLPGRLGNLNWRAAPRLDPAADEIEIRPMAVGLNFRDVMYAMGLLSDEAVENGFAGPSMGMELAGVVTRIGSAVTEFGVGDPVIAFAPACFAKRALTKADCAVAKPAEWSFEEAATVPTVFFTVYYALHYLARLQAGEKVLIHGAAGGVGIAAIQVARYLGAEIFATAGSDEKRDFVRLLGADHVLDSRSLAFADDILAITDGGGIDVVLNSLAGEAINRNLRVLRPFGRFLELGKRDFYENTRIGLRPFKDNIAYHGIDADQLMVERPALAASLFRDVMALFQQGVLKPLPYRTFPAESIVDAFRYMQQAKQIGKIVVGFDREPVAGIANPPPARAPSLRRDATYLVSGGLGGFGLKTALWLAERGAGHIVLLGRRGAEAPEAAAAIAELKAAGAVARVMACDVADADRLAEVIAEIDRDLPPLKGIVHAAMVLDDALIGHLDRDRFHAVLGPKMLGAWNLHRLTGHLTLDLFVVYSSATTFVGNPGQANYVAANLYLEALAAHRRDLGLAATSVCWGAIGDVGYLARNQTVKEALQSRIGGTALDSDQALRQLGEIVADGRSGIAVVDIEWRTLCRHLPAALAPRFNEPRRGMAKTATEATEREDIRTLIANRGEDEVRDILGRLLTEEIAQILRLPADRIPTDRSLYEIGMDSLMGVELALGIEKRFGIVLPLMALSEGPTIARIGERLTRQLLGQPGAEEAPAQTGEDARIDAVLAGMAAQHGIVASREDLDQAAAALKSYPTAAGLAL